MGDKEKKPLRRAVWELRVHYQKIKTVGAWAKHMGYSRAYFSRCIKRKHGRSPKEILAEIKLKRVKRAIRQNPDAIGYKIAVKSNFTDEKALYKFLKIYYSTTLTELREEML